MEEKEYKLTKEQKREVRKIVNRYFRINFKKKLKKFIGVNIK